MVFYIILIIENAGQFGENCIATGWGKTNFGDQTYQQLMKQIQLPMVDNAKCQQQLRVAKDDSGATILSHDFDLDESFNCAGYD